MKKEPVNRMDLPQSGASQRTGGGAGVTIVTGNGNAETLGGYHASTTGAPSTIPVLDANGYLPASVLPTSAETATNANGTEMGPRYIGPTAWLVSSLKATDGFVTINGWIGEGNEYAVIQHYSAGIEYVQLAGASTTVKANQFRYAIRRGERGTTPLSFPAGAKIVSLGKKARGGYMVENSGSGLYAPYLDTWQNDADADGNVTTDLTTRVGNLAGIGVSENASVIAFRDQFTGSPAYPVDWNVHGIATENGYFSGHLIAKGGSIVGLLDVTGKLQIGDPDSPASMEMGETVAGWGMAMRNQFGRPFWSLVSAYEAATGEQPETVWSVIAEGEQVIWLRRSDVQADQWVLDIGPFRVQKGVLASTARDADNSNKVVIDTVYDLYKFGPHQFDISTAALFGQVQILPTGDVAGKLTVMGSASIGDTGTVNIDSGGHLTLEGTATAWEDLRVEPNVRGTGSNNPAFEQYFTNGAGSVGVFLYSFTDVAAANEKEIFFTAQMPHGWAGTAVYPHVHWIPSASDTTATPRWGLEYTWADIGTVFGNSTIVYAVGNTSGAADLVANTHYITSFAAITPSASQDGPSSVIICRLFRNSSDAADTYNVGGNKCGLLYIDIHYEVNKFGTNAEYA